MFRFNEYIEKKRLDEEQQERDILKEKKLKALAYETQDAGWIALEGNPELVSEYVKHITRNNNK
jgi:hypothetical protein